MKKISISKKILSLTLCLAISFFAVSGLAAEDSDKNKLVELMDVMLEDFLNPSEPPSKAQQTQTTSQKEQPAQSSHPAESVIPAEPKQTADVKPDSVEPIEEKPLKTVELPKPVETAVPEHVPIVEEYITLDVQDDEPEEEVEPVKPLKVVETPETPRIPTNENKKIQIETSKSEPTENKVTNTKKSEPVSEIPKTTTVEKKADTKKSETTAQTQKTTTDNKTANSKKKVESKNSTRTIETQKNKKTETVTETPKSKSQAKTSRTEKASEPEQPAIIRHEEITFEEDEDFDNYDDDDEIEIITVEEDKPVLGHVEINTDKKVPQDDSNIIFKDDTNEIIGFDPFLYDDEPDFIYQPYVALGVEANKTTFTSAIKPIVGGDGLIQNFGMNIQYEKLIKPTISLGIIGGGTYNFKKDNKVFGMRLGLTGRKYFQMDSFRNLPYGFFVQGELGASAVYSNGSFVKDSKLNSKISPMGILKLGYRLYVLKSPMYFEPFVRGGYPLGVSAGITFGTNW